MSDTPGEKKCELCHGCGFVWFKDRRIPWMSQHPIIPSLGVHGDVLFCRSVCPCSMCYPTAYARWEADYDHSMESCQRGRWEWNTGGPPEDEER